MSTDERLDDLLRQALPGSGADAGCPPETIWLDLLAGRIEGAEAERLRSHLADCAACAAAAHDARRFARAFEIAPPSHSWVPGALAAAAILAAAAAALLLYAGGTEGPRRDAVARLVAELDVAAPERSVTAADEGDLVYRGAAPDERAASLDAALAAYRARRFAEGCEALVAHGRRYPADRTGRYYAGLACLEAGELDRADELLAGLAASAGERRDEARQVLERLRRARDEDSR